MISSARTSDRGRGHYRKKRTYYYSFKHVVVRSIGPRTCKSPGDNRHDYHSENDSTNDLFTSLVQPRIVNKVLVNYH